MVKQRVEISQRTPRILICAYGTLRKGHGNWEYYLKDKSVYLGTDTTEPGYTMYSTGGFPIIVDQGEGTIEYDVFQITDKTVLDKIHQLEGCTGIPEDPKSWYDIKAIETPYGRAYIYVQHEPENLPIVESGNWNKEF